MATNCVNCLMPSLSQRQVSMGRKFCQKCYQTIQYITGPCFGCRNAYTSEITNRKLRGHYCMECNTKYTAQYMENYRRRKQVEEEQRILREAQAEEQMRRITEERRRWEEERRRREAEERRTEAERLEQERLENERQYNAGIDSISALDHRALCKMIYDMHLKIDQLHTMNESMQETIDSMQETIDSYQTAFKKVRMTANQCFNALDSHNLLKTTTPDTSDESEYEQ